ncbi:hypothetical protein [Oceanobacillus neutriphilus]|uniref:PepSY domain-containing protein n=1 Tax=Oceanobacillus neutriphilus TaxID=531815 RepID=A0ABQ2NXY7_9BACI|nr:hypothetical protein [Oceanobacillus neutriphilus]GGP13221.1 hypothetical protein GCM10011346_32330 [Oceanobacillus neutriphilus]
MKNILKTAGLLIILLIISACQPEENHEATEAHPSDRSTEEVSEQSQDTSEEGNNDSEPAADEEAYEYEEQKVIGQQIEDGEYDVVVETDNNGSRVMFYEIDGEKYYKTIFVKNDNRLKIIDIRNNNGQIYNDII